MAVNAVDYQNLIVASLSDADVSLQTELEAKISFYWRLHARAPYLELRYWLTRRDMIRVAMACVTRQVDYLRRNLNSSRQSIESSNQVSTMTAQSEENGSSVSDRSAESQYDDETNSTGIGSSSMSRNSTQSANGEMHFTDTGQGLNYVSRHLHNETETTERGQVETVQDDDYAVLSDRTGGGYREGQTDIETNPGGYGLDIGVFSAAITIEINFPSINTPFGTFTFDPWILSIPIPLSITKSTTTNGSVSTHDEVVHDITGALGGDMVREQISDINVLVQPKRELHMTMTDAPARAHSSHSEFTANVIQTEVATTNSNMTASGLSSSSNEMTGAGSGTASSTGTSESSLIGSSSRSAHGEGTAQRSTQSVSQMDSLMERLHQRFLHLQSLWKQADEMIRWLESQRLGVPAYVVQQITIQYPEGVQTQNIASLTAVANQYLVRQPG